MGEMPSAQLDQFLGRFDDVDLEALAPLRARGIAAVEQLDITDILKELPTTEHLFDCADRIRTDARAGFPQALALWHHYREPVLGIMPLREAYRVQLSDGDNAIVTNPYKSRVLFKQVPLPAASKSFEPEDAALAILHDCALVVDPQLRIIGEEFQVANAIVHYELFPYLAHVLGIEHAKRVRDPFMHALAKMLRNKHEPHPFSSDELFGRRYSKARELYDACKTPHELLRHVRLTA